MCIRFLLLAMMFACGAPTSQPAPPPVLAPMQPVTAVTTAPPTATKPPASSDPDAWTEGDQRRDADRVALATAIVDAYQNWNGFFTTLVASWSSDGNSIVFGSTRDGVQEIYVGDPAHPDAPPRAVTTGPQRALDAVVTRDGKWIIYIRDHDGDENHSLWRVPLAGGEATELTPNEPLRRSRPLLPQKQPGVMFYDAMNLAEPVQRLYRQDIAGGAPVLVYKQPTPGDLVDVSADATHALMTEFHSPSDVVVTVVDVKKGDAHRLYPPEGTHKSVYDVAYAGDQRSVLVATDDGDNVVLLELDAKTSKERKRFHAKDYPFAPLAVAVSPKGDRIAVGLDAGNHGEIRILDGRTLELQRKVEVPLGDVHLGVWRPDGAAFSIMLSRPDQPADPFVVDAKTGTVSPLRKDARPALASLSRIDASIQSAKAHDGLTIPINQYLPPHDANAKLPVIVIFHGGPFSSSAVRWNAYARFFVSLGYAVLEPNVRGSTGFGHVYEEGDNREKRSDWLADVQSVNTWVKSQPWADPDRVVVWGQSYGGYTTLMALTRQPRAWRAGVDLYGPVDLRTLLLSSDAAVRAVLTNEFGDVEKDAALLEQFSPMRDADKVVQPLFVYQGATDPRVKRSESDMIVKTVRQRGVTVEYMLAANEGHGVDHRETKIELLARTALFIESALR